MDKETDMQFLIRKMQCDNVKHLRGKVEFRVKNLEYNVNQARQIIQDDDLDLKVVQSGEMARYRAFEVWEGRG